MIYFTAGYRHAIHNQPPTSQLNPKSEKSEEKTKEEIAKEAEEYQRGYLAGTQQRLSNTIKEEGKKQLYVLSANTTATEKLYRGLPIMEDLVNSLNRNSSAVDDLGDKFRRS